MYQILSSRPKDAPSSQKGMSHLKRSSLVIYLKVQKEEIFKRISDIKERGVVLFDSQSLDDMYLERIGLYEKYADITLKEEGCSIEDTVQAIVAQI